MESAPPLDNMFIVDSKVKVLGCIVDYNNNNNNNNNNFIFYIALHYEYP